MATSVVMPALEMAQENGKLLAWRKKEGERVSKGEPLLEIETDKAVVEVEAPGDGILAGITATQGRWSLAELPANVTAYDAAYLALAEALAAPLLTRDAKLASAAGQRVSANGAYSGIGCRYAGTG